MALAWTAVTGRLIRLWTRPLHGSCRPGHAVRACVPRPRLVGPFDDAEATAPRDARQRARIVTRRHLARVRTHTAGFRSIVHASLTNQAISAYDSELMCYAIADELWC